MRIEKIISPTRLTERLNKFFKEFSNNAGEADYNKDKKRKEKTHFEPPYLIYRWQYIKVIFS